MDTLLQETLLQQVEKTVRDASRLMDNSHISVSQKGNDSNFVTSADTAVQEYLIPRLTGLVPNSTVLAEEEGQCDTSGEYVWIVDPIDGTSNFMRGFGFSCISVALYKNGQGYLGVVYDPKVDEMFTCEKGKGAYLNGNRIHVSDKPYKRGLLFSAMCIYAKQYAPICFNVIRKVFSEADDMRRLGTAALELCYLACGRAELYFEIRLFPWDAAAGILMIEEAGGYTERLFADKIESSKPFPLIAANKKESFDRLREIVLEEMPKLPY